MLTISVEEPTLPKGENFKVNVELMNTSGEDKEIVFVLLFKAHIPGWDPYGCGDEGCPIDCGCAVWTDLPPPQSRLLPAGSVIRDIGLWGSTIDGPWLIGSTLIPGTHELRFSAGFHIYYGQDDLPHDQQTVVWSNTIILTVQ